MDLHGKQLIGAETSGEGKETLVGENPATGAALAPTFFGATSGELNRALQLATDAFPSFRKTTGEKRADFLLAIASEIEALGDALIERAQVETGLPAARLQGERGRTLTQLRIFADVVREGSWVDATIDRADPERKPLPKPDVRSLNVPVGPVAVFGASNFPLAISVIGNDTVAALAVGCPVVVKAHPAHPGTSEMMGRAVQAAVKKSGLHAGVFSMLHGASVELGAELVKHPQTKAVAFTGSLRGGRALFDIANARPNPIPVYAEMSSLNPVLIFPGALKERGMQIAEGLVQSVALGVGQFCTKPGLVLGVESSDFQKFSAAVGEAAKSAAPATMLRKSIHNAYTSGVAKLSQTPGVATLGTSTTVADAKMSQAGVAVFAASAEVYNAEEHLAEENFGPSALVIACKDRSSLVAQVRALHGHLAACIHATEQDLVDYADLIAELETKVGRIVLNGFSTGIDLCTAMVHGGPYPATTFSQYTSMGQKAFLRFVRPVCYQSFPQTALPASLQDKNPLGIWRTVDGKRSNGAL